MSVELCSVENLQEHNEYLHSDDLDCSAVNQKPKCNKCDLSFSTTKKLDQHKDLKHGVQKALRNAMAATLLMALMLAGSLGFLIGAILVL